MAMGFWEKCFYLCTCMNLGIALGRLLGGEAFILNAFLAGCTAVLLVDLLLMRIKAQ